jgi:hypothetical protein
MGNLSATRIKFYRLNKRLVSSIELLFEKKKITATERKRLLKKASELYAELRAEIREARRPFARPNGRPKSVQVPRNVAHPTCKREGCSRPSAPEQVYCSPNCAPLSKFGSEWVRNHARK